ncbi:MAG: hypothetical protein HZY76_02945 [Anaerolineae bacterium]|nr:MAG: hypothetical protein HZY76_02945 [Anaerolineae bacterium]
MTGQVGRGRHDTKDPGLVCSVSTLDVPRLFVAGRDHVPHLGSSGEVTSS